MDLKNVSKFIQERRKAKGLTQVQLAEKLCVSEKTVSKWETGRGFPDTSLILPLCNELGISANELLSGKLIADDKEYREIAEKNLVNLKSQQVRNNKNILMLEWVLLWFGLAILLGCCAVAAYVQMADVYRILILVFGILNLLGAGIVGTIIETKVGFYECGHCHHKYVPTYKQVIMAMHFGRTRYMKCPKCGKVSWQKKAVTNDNEE
jgi:transcriptional regulator with XRE-family HTH domain